MGVCPLGRAFQRARSGGGNCPWVSAGGLAGGGTDGPPYGMPIAPTDSPQDLC
jgi:hypothetical protein